MTNEDGRAGVPPDGGVGARDGVLTDLPLTSVTPEKSAQVKAGGKLEYPNLGAVSRSGLKFDTEVTDY